MRTKRWLVLLAAFSMLFSLSYLMVGCSQDDETTPIGPGDGQYTADSKADCRGCHTNEAMLKATVIPEGEGITDLASNEGGSFRMPSGEG